MTVTVEIEANAKDGFAGNVRRTVSENCPTLKSVTHEVED